NAISVGLFLSPIPTFLSIIRHKSVQHFKSDPYLATILNCALWVFYGMPFVHPDSTLVVTINGFGLFIQAAYISIFFIYSSWGKTKKMIVILLVEIIFFAGVVLITLNTFHTTTRRSTLVGSLCVAFNIIMYSSPLTVMKMVIKTKSVKYMPFWLSVASLCNGIVWFIYALIKFDPWVAVPNGLGALSGVVQLILYAVYYRTTDWNETDPKEVQLPEP
ncbi:Bidirectional sugar transporter SWEET5-like protein, partial [Drosera capensis]